MNRDTGLTLLELMIVVTVLATISAFAIPNFTDARISGNEASAISSMRALSTCNEQYRIRFGQYAPSLGDLQATGVVDQNLLAGQKSGYTFDYQLTGDIWECGAEPLDPPLTGERYFFVDDSGVIRGNPSGPADISSDPID